MSKKAIITLLWDLDARPHEITALRVRDIVLNEQYGEGNIPSNTLPTDILSMMEDIVKSIEILNIPTIPDPMAP